MAIDTSEDAWILPDPPEPSARPPEKLVITEDEWRQAGSLRDWNSIARDIHTLLGFPKLPPLLPHRSTYPRPKLKVPKGRIPAEFYAATETLWRDCVIHFELLRTYMGRIEMGRDVDLDNGLHTIVLFHSGLGNRMREALGPGGTRHWPMLQWFKGLTSDRLSALESWFVLYHPKEALAFYRPLIGTVAPEFQTLFACMGSGPANDDKR